MVKTIAMVCLWVTLFLLSGARVWSLDMEDRFINPDFDTSKNIFIDVKGASLINVLKIISQQSGLSFIANQDVVDKKITIYLNKIPLNQALQMVLDANGLTYELQKDSNVFVVKAKVKTAKNLITKVYQLKYATVSTSKLFSTITTSGIGAAGSTTSMTGGAYGPVGTSTAAGVSSTSASTSGLEQVLKDALSPDGKVVEDARTNSLIITDNPAQFDIIESTINRLDVPVPQILIEVEMVDVSKSTADQLGITYGATPLTFTGGTKATNFPFGPTLKKGDRTPGSWDATGMTAALSFLATTTDARTLARPRILTLNNETAQIQISTDQAVSVEPSQTSTSTGGASGSAVSTNTVERVTTGVILKVTPQANLLTREITLAVSPKVIDVILAQVQPTGDSGGSKIFDPVTRGSDSILKLKDGQSMVIGGLMTSQLNNVTTKLPFLGDLPLIGRAFRSENNQKIDRELIIFLTPHIIDDPNQLAIKGGVASISVRSALDKQTTTDRFLEINTSLNSYETKSY
jgi:type II secretory pathway component GspD/PulD (secretin)